VWLYDVNLDRRMGDLILNRWREDINWGEIRTWE
jgi:hypothetical protein